MKSKKHLALGQINTKKGMYRLELPDGTSILWTPRAVETIVKPFKKKISCRLHVCFPKDKFWPLFEQQMHDGSKHLSLAFSDEEVMALNAFAFHIEAHELKRLDKRKK